MKIRPRDENGQLGEPIPTPKDAMKPSPEQRIDDLQANLDQAVLELTTIIATKQGGV